MFYYAQLRLSVIFFQFGATKTCYFLLNVFIFIIDKNQFFNFNELVLLQYEKMFIELSIYYHNLLFIKPVIFRHMFVQVGEQHCQIEADISGGFVKSLGEIHVIYLVIVCRYCALYQKVYLLTGKKISYWKNFLWLIITFYVYVLTQVYIFTKKIIFRF